MNKDWEGLKKSKNGIPTYESLIPYVLEVMKNKEEVTNRTIIDRVMKYLEIPKTIIDIKYPNYPELDGILINRFSFTLSILYKAKAVERPKRGVYRITTSGESLLNQYGEKLSRKQLELQPAYKEYMEELAIRTAGKSEEMPEELITDDDLNIEKNHVETLIMHHNNEVGAELLEKLRNVEPYFFEKIVINLLGKMGYSGKNGKAMVTNKTNDGGIDGIINQDPLGTSSVYIQAKRYKEGNTIGRPDIQSFYGALANFKSDRGVFITTSRFSSGASEFAKNQGIVLIDGIKLTDLMMEYEVGIQVEKEYKQYRVDNDYFELD